MDVFSSNGAVDVKKISALKCISDKDQIKIQELYNQLHDQNFNYAVRWKNRQLKKNAYIRKFEKCYFCVNQNGLLKPFAKVFLVGSKVHYTITERHLAELNLPKKNAEYLTLMYIYRPTISNDHDGLIFSIFNNIDAHLHALENEISHDNEHGFVCVPYQLDTEDIIKDESDDVLLKHQVVVLDNGLVIIG